MNITSAIWGFSVLTFVEDKKDSNLDILVEFSKEPDLLEFVGLKQELSEILGVEMDLVMKSALKPRIGKRILEEVVQV